MSYNMSDQIKYLCSMIGMYERDKETRTLVVVVENRPHKYFLEQVVAETQMKDNVRVYVRVCTEDHRVYWAMNIDDWIAFSDNIPAETINLLNYRMTRHREHKAHKTLQTPSS